MTVTPKEAQELTLLTQEASSANDLDTLRKIHTMLQQPDPEGFEDQDGHEWFYILLTSDQLDAVLHGD